MLSLFRSISGMICAVFHRHKLEDRLRDEWQLHIDLLVEKNMRLGMTREEAQRHACITVGGFDQTRESVCDARGVRWFHELVRNLFYAVRIFLRQKALSLTVIGMLALACCANSVIFSIYNSLYLKVLPFPDSERLVEISENAPLWNLTDNNAGISYRDFHEWRKQNQSFEAMGLYRQEVLNYSPKGGARMIKVLLVTYDFGSVFRIQPVIGRGFLEEEDLTGGPRVVMLGYGFWKREFGGSPSALGETLKLDGEAYTVVGVLPRHAFSFGDIDLWAPLQKTSTEFYGHHWMNGIGRLKEGVTLEEALEDITYIHKSMIETRPTNKITSPALRPLREMLFGSGLQMKIFLYAVGLLLLIVCVNIAGMMLARSDYRSLEMGIRNALGASRAGIIRQLLTESLILAIPGVLLGVFLGVISLNFWLSAADFGLPSWVNLMPDIRFLLFCGLLLAVTTVLSGLAPALQAARINLLPTLNEASGRSSASGAKRRGLSVLMIGEVAVTFVLLIGAGLLLRTWEKVQAVELGFQTDNVLIYRIDLPASIYKEHHQRANFYERLIENHRSLPGITAVSAATHPPLTNYTGCYIDVEGRPTRSIDELDPATMMNAVFPGYFETIGMHPAAGRTFTDLDGRTRGSRVAIVNESFSRYFWPNEDPIGKRIRFRGITSDDAWMTVVGLNRDIKHWGPDQEMRPELCIPYVQSNFVGASMANWMHILIRSRVDPTGLLDSIRSQLHELDPNVAVGNPTTMVEKVDQALIGRRLSAYLMTLFAITSLLVAAAGIYGVVSYTVSRRRYEIGIRMALGATRGQVLRMVFGGGMRLVFAGVVLGVAGAFMASQAMKSMLFGIDSFDGRTYILVTTVLLCIIAAATLLPARRAAGIDPMQTLRSE